MVYGDEIDFGANWCTKIPELLAIKLFVVVVYGYFGGDSESYDALPEFFCVVFDVMMEPAFVSLSIL